MQNLDSHNQLKQELRRRIVNKINRELGTSICSLLNEDSITEIMLNPDGKLWIERLGNNMEPVGKMPATQAECLMRTLASCKNSAITTANPILECELPDGSRFTALIPPVVSAPTFCIRKRAVQIFTLDQYVKTGVMQKRQCDIIKDAIKQHKNLLVVGGAGAGKTTLVNAMIAHINNVTPNDRIVIIEDTKELQCSAKNVVLMQTSDYVDMIKLLKTTLRLKPDRILIGEVRDGTAHALLKSWNTGNHGGLATVHANSADAGLTRMEQLVEEVSNSPSQSLIAEAIDLIIFIKKNTYTKRKIEDIITINGHNGNTYNIQYIS